jgi:B-block binding subunit of TFIIIC
LTNRLLQGDSSVPQIALQALEEAGRGREQGTTQIDLSRAFERDAKTVFHFVKSMVNRGYLYVHVVFFYATLSIKSQTEI